MHKNYNDFMSVSHQKIPNQYSWNALEFPKETNVSNPVQHIYIIFKQKSIVADSIHP